MKFGGKRRQRKRVVCDTNILVWAFVFPAGSPEQVVRLARLGQVEMFLSPPILEELARVLRQKFGYTQPEVRQRVSSLRSLAQVVDPRFSVTAIHADEPDNRILECALEARADFIVSGDKHLLTLPEFEGIPVVKAAEIVRFLTGGLDL